MRHEFPGIPTALVHGVFTAHLYVAAERQCVDAIVRVALLETYQALAETNGKLLHANSQQFGHSIVTEFVNQDHESQNHAHGKHSS